MIEIQLRFLGGKTVATFTVEKPGADPRTIEIARRTGAKAMNAAVGRLRRLSLSGQEWCATGGVTMRGVVPGRRH